MMIKNGMHPVHAGEILREEYLVPLNLSANALAKAIGVTPARINDIVREKRGITVDAALRLAKYFETTPQFWLNLQQSYELRLGEQTAQLDDIRPYYAQNTAQNLTAFA